MVELSAHPAIREIRTRRADLAALVGQFVQCHASYGTPGQDRAMRLAGARLQAAGFTVEHRAVDGVRLRRSPHYVDVTRFGGDFASYEGLRRPSLRARRIFSDDGPYLVLNGHLDVEFVTSPQTWAEPGLWASGALRGDRVYGRGASDMLGGVAAYLFVLEVLARHADQARGTVGVQLVVDEEIGGNGTLWELLDHDGPRPEVALIAEPSGGVVCRHTRGFHQFLVRCPGVPVHMVYAHEYDNANRVLADVILLLEELERWVARQCPDGRRHRNVMYGLVRGGSDSAVPAEMAEVAVTLAVPAGMSARTVQGHFEQQLTALAERLPVTPVVVPYGISLEPATPSDHPLATHLLDVGHELGVPLTAGEFPSACDARLFRAFDIPALVYGPGSLARAHGSDEYVTVDELVDFASVLAGALLQYWAAA